MPFKNNLPAPTNIQVHGKGPMHPLQYHRLTLSDFNTPIERPSILEMKTLSKYEWKQRNLHGNWLKLAPLVDPVNVSSFRSLQQNVTAH
jgi:hypothetical protein